MKPKRNPLPPFPGQVVHGGILYGISEEELAGRPPVPPVEFVMPPDTPPDVLAAIRQADEETKAWLAAQKAG